MKKFLSIALVAILILVGLGYVVIPKLFAPDYSENLMLEGIESETKIYYDDYGIPHIKAQSKSDAWYALGYAHAKDRLFQMDLLRRAGGGRLSGLLGDDLMDVDEFFITLGTEQAARESYEYVYKDSDEEWRTLSDAYIAGINAFIASDQAPLEYTLIGVQPEPFEALDLYRVAGYMSFSFAMALKTEPVIHQMEQRVDSAHMAALSLHPEDWHEKIPVYNPRDTSAENNLLSLLDRLPTPLLKGSNSWVVAPQKSKSGKTLFANDTHIEFASPSVWYEAHISTPEQEVYGNFLGGFPFPLLGHNEHHAWGITMFENDDMDLFAEKINDDTTQVMFQGMWISTGQRIDTIRSSTGKQRIVKTRITPHGPFLNGVLDNLDQPTTMYWTYTKVTADLVEMAYNLNEAKTIESFEKNLEKLASPGLNIMYGDSEGNIAWWAAAQLIKRPEGVNPKTIQVGWDGSADPMGFYAFEHNPKSINPPSGFVYSANNQPDSTSIGWYPGYYYHGDRARRISQLLNEKEVLSIDDFKAIQLDNQSLMAARICNNLLHELSLEDSEHKTLVNKLLKWNYTYDLEAVEPLIYTIFTHELMALAMVDELGDETFKNFQSTFAYKRSLPKFVMEANHAWWDNINTEDIETREAIVMQALNNTSKFLAENYGEESNWKWKDATSLTHKHPVGENEWLGRLYNVGPFSVAGGEEVINKMSYAPSPSAHYEVKSGPAIRRIIDYSDYRSSENILPTGNSGNVFSPHYDDQAAMFATGQWRAQIMDWDAIEGSDRVTVLRGK